MECPRRRRAIISGRPKLEKPGQGAGGTRRPSAVSCGSRIKPAVSAAGLMEGSEEKAQCQLPCACLCGRRAVSPQQQLALLGCRVWRRTGQAPRSPDVRAL